MERKIRLVLADHWSRSWLLVAILVNASLWLAIWRLFPRTEGATPLHYTIYFGINLTGSWVELLILPGVGLLAIISHLIISRAVPHSTWIRLWGLLSMIINILALIAATTILYVVRVNGL